MRIIGGQHKGKLIKPPLNYKARPTTDYAREALFNILENELCLEEKKVLDLFGGTGAISFEFASRGAEQVYCVEMLRENALFIRQQAESLGLKGQITVVRNNVFDFLTICKLKYDIVFADPPYDIRQLESLPDKVFENDILEVGAYFILEHAGNRSFVNHPFFVKEKSYGKVHFSFFRKGEGDLQP